MTSFATALPENSNDGYVAAAYIVFFAIVLVYVVIMAIRLGRVERAVRELRARDTSSPDGAGAGSDTSTKDGSAHASVKAGESS